MLRHVSEKIYGYTIASLRESQLGLLDYSIDLAKILHLQKSSRSYTCAGMFHFLCTRL